MIKILIVDDSPTDTAILKYLFDAEPDLQVIACARNGQEAVTMVAQFKPDLVTMDLQMPYVNGFEAIRTIMAQHPLPIVVISSVLGDSELNASFRALDAGALYVMEKPHDVMSDAFVRTKRFMLDTIRSMSTITVFRKNRFATPLTLAKVVQPNPASQADTVSVPKQKYELLSIGASVGGPQALKIILSSLPEDFPLPIVIVQHMSVGFIHGFASWMNEKTKLKVKAAEQHEILHAGTVYIAPDHYHLEVARMQDALTVRLITGVPVSGFLPSITVLMRSVAHATGGRAVGMLLTGMGNDGAQGMLELKHMQGHTLVQDPESAIVFGMGAVAQTLGAVDRVVELERTADYLIRVCKK